MRLSTRPRYALWLMLEIARRAEHLPVALADIARSTNLSRRYLEQLATALKTADLLRGRSGRAGGYTLTRAAAAVTIREIIEAVIGPVNVVACVRHPGVCSRASLCECRWMYATINERIERLLDQLTLADLVDEPHPDRTQHTGSGAFAGCPVPPGPRGITSDQELDP